MDKEPMDRQLTIHTKEVRDAAIFRIASGRSAAQVPGTLRLLHFNL